MKTQNYKIIFLGIIASVLFVGCGNVRMNSIFDDDSIENSANSSSKSYLENNAIDYTVNDDGTYTCNGNIYKYKLTLTGDTSESGKVGIFIVLTNDKNLTFDEVFDCLISSKLDAGESHFILIGSM